jgi:hypothetical protein
MREQYCLARMAPNTAAFRQNGSVLGHQSGASPQIARVTTYAREAAPYFWPATNRRSTWRFIALTGVAVIAVWAGAATLLSMELTFAPAVLLR